MSRLITFGCSWTAGRGLSNPLAESWTAVLGNMLKLESVNNGLAGASNLEILYNILNFDFSSSDIVVILWTFKERDLVFDTNNSFLRIGPWMDKLRDPEGHRRLLNWSSAHNDRDNFVRCTLHIHHAKMFLENKKIRNYDFSINQTESLLTDCPQWTNVDRNYATQPNLNVIDRVNDNVHPGPNSHSQFAKQIYQLITE